MSILECKQVYPYLEFVDKLSLKCFNRPCFSVEMFPVSLLCLSHDLLHEISCLFWEMISKAEKSISPPFCPWPDKSGKICTANQHINFQDSETILGEMRVDKRRVAGKRHLCIFRALCGGPVDCPDLIFLQCIIEPARLVSLVLGRLCPGVFPHTVSFLRKLDGILPLFLCWGEESWKGFWVRILAGGSEGMGTGEPGC